MPPRPSHQVRHALVLCFALVLIASACGQETVVSGPAERTEQTQSTSNTDATATDGADALDAADSSDDPRSGSTQTDDADSDPDSNTVGTSSQDQTATPGDKAEQAEEVVGDIDSIGSQEQINSLVEDCETGVDMACDILFQASDFDSPEELVARTCGGQRPDNFGFCTEGMVADGANIWFAEDSPGLSAVVGACEIGSMTACDFLYFRSEVGSAYEDMGNTCAGRTEIAIPDCRTAFPGE